MAAFNDPTLIPLRELRDAAATAHQRDLERYAEQERKREAQHRAQQIADRATCLQHWLTSNGVDAHPNADGYLDLGDGFRGECIYIHGDYHLQVSGPCPQCGELTRGGQNPARTLGDLGGVLADWAPAPWDHDCPVLYAEEEAAEVAATTALRQPTSLERLADALADVIAERLAVRDLERFA